MSTITATVQLRRDTAANWTANNPTLLAGEVGFETDTKRAKLGDGVTAWNSLAYIDPSWLLNDSVTNAKLANMAQATIKGRQAGSGTGDPEDLTASQARTALGLGTAALVNTGTGSSDVPTITQADARYIQSQFAVLGSNFTTNSATPVDVTGLAVTLDANSTYLVDIAVVMQSSNTSTGYSVTMTITGSPTVRNFDRRMFTSGTVATDQVINTDDGGPGFGSIDSANANRPVNMVGVVVTSGSAATIQMRLVRGGSANNITMIAGSSIIARKVA